MNRSVFFLISALLLVSLNSFHAEAALLSPGSLPAIYFSDLQAGSNTGGQDNKGLFVTIWGGNFGSERGSSYVTIGGGKADNYPVWTDTKITFQLGSKAVSGSIKVVKGKNISNGIPFTIRNGKIYFVKKSGSDRKGDGSWKKPWSTIIYAKNKIKPGDTVYACQGTDATELDVDKECIALSSNGKAGKYKALVAYPKASVTIGSMSVKRAIQTMLPDGSGSSYWVVSQFKLTGQEMVFNARENSKGLRLVGNSITCPDVGDVPMAAVAGIADHFYILGNVFYNCGKYPKTSREYHNIYIGNHLKREVSDIEIGWNVIRDSMACRAIQFHTEGDDAGPVSDVRIHDNRISNIRSNGIYIGYLCTGTWKIYNNILSNCGMGPSWNGVDADCGGITLRDNNAGVLLYNNILVNCGYNSKLEKAHDAWYSSAGLNLQNYTGKLDIHNNIFYQSIPNGDKHYPYTMFDEKSTGLSAGEYNNLFYGSGSAPQWDTSAINADPQFVNITRGNFSLLNSSPALTKGFVQIPAAAVSTGY